VTFPETSVNPPWVGYNINLGKIAIVSQCHSVADKPVGQGII